MRCPQCDVTIKCSANNLGPQHVLAVAFIGGNAGSKKVKEQPPPTCSH